MTIPLFSLAADTLLVRPVDVPAPWYSVATGILSIVVTLLLLGIAIALLGMARALKGAERNLGGRMQGLADELVPLARNLNHIATQLSEVTEAARGDLAKLSGTVGAVDDAVRDAIDAGEWRLRRFGTLLDAVQDEAQATVASATGAMRGMRTGAGSMVASLFGRNGTSKHRARTRRPAPDEEHTTIEEDDVRARLALLEAAFAERNTDEDDAEADDEPTVHSAAARGSRTMESVPGNDADDDDEWDDDDDEDDLIDDDDDDLDDDDDDADDPTDDSEPDDEDDTRADRDDGRAEPTRADAGERGPRSGGPRIRTRRTT